MYSCHLHNWFKNYQCPACNADNAGSITTSVAIPIINPQPMTYIVQQDKQTAIGGKHFDNNKDVVANLVLTLSPELQKIVSPGQEIVEGKDFEMKDACKPTSEYGGFGEHWFQIALPITPAEEEKGEDAFIQKHLKIVMDKTLISMIHFHIERMWGGLEMASVQHFMETGRVNGSFLLNIKELAMQFAKNWHTTATPQGSDAVDWEQVFKDAQEMYRREFIDYYYTRKPEIK